MAKPHSEVVAQAWLKGLGLNAGVATQLPTDVYSWGSKPFILIEGVVGGSVDAQQFRFSPVLSIAVYAVTIRTDNLGTKSIEPKPPFKTAADLMQDIVVATLKFSDIYAEETPVILPADYDPAYIQEVYPITMPRRRPGDQGNYAIYDMNLQMHWSLNI